MFLARALLLAALAAAAAGCSFSADPMSGQQCAAPTASKRCPDGFVCMADNRCWRPGTGPSTDGPPDAPPDGPVPDGSPPPDTRPADVGPIIFDAPPFEVTPSRPLPSGNRLVPGGRWAASETYKVVKTTAATPGARVMESQRYRVVGGLIGATQK